MKGTFFAAAAAMAGAASASNHRHAHQQFAKRGHAASTGFPQPTSSDGICTPGCTTIWKTVTGEATLVPIPVTTVTSTSTSTSTVTITPIPTSTTTVVVVPTPEVQKCPTPGTYTFPATTLTVTDTTTVCGATTTKVPSGTHTIGGVTTIVTTQTTVTCPVATVQTTGGVTTSTIVMTEYVCPSAGTYTIGAQTTSCDTETVIVYPTPTTIAPGTYTKPQVVVTATETDYVTVCPYTSSGLPTSTPAPAPPAPVASSTAASTPSAAPSSPSNSKTSVQGKTDLFGITYNPYESQSGKCKTAEQVAQDIAQIKAAGFEAVRIYGTDCDTLTNVVPACIKEGIEVIAGIFIKPGNQCSINDAAVKKQVEDLNAMGHWDVVRLLVVGNESAFNKLCTGAELAQLIKDVRSQCSGYTGPITCAETLNVWLDTSFSGPMCEAVDVCGANIHAIFNPDVTASGAGAFVKGQMDILQGICGKSVINLESGWKHSGPCNGDACPGVDEQKTAIASIRGQCGSQSVYFDFDDAAWKGPDDAPWGLGDVFGFKTS